VPPRIDSQLFQEVRDELKALRAEVQSLKLEFATYKGVMRVFNWIAFTAMPAIGAFAAYFGFKVGVIQTH
jgi:hypothetical protein